MKKLFLTLSLLLIVFMAACSRAQTSPTISTAPTQPAAPGIAPAPDIGFSREEAVSVAPMPPTAPKEGTFDQSPDADRMIVRTGNMALVVDDVNIAIQQIASMAGRFEGYVVSSNVWQDRERLYGNISIRVPAERFDDSIRELRALASDVTSETTYSRDVTEEYVDLSAKLKNLEATEAQLLRILEKAEKVEDILAVQRELSRTRGEIEQTKGRMQYLERTTSTSLIDVSLQQSKLSVEFNASKTTVKERELIRFAADVAGGFTPYSFQWDLGDGTTVTDSSFLHSYKNDGKYMVTLTVSDDRGKSVTRTRIDYVTVTSAWNVGNIAGNAWNGLVGFGRGVANVFIWLAVFSPVWLVVGGIIFYFFWYRRRKQKTP